MTEADAGEIPQAEPSPVLDTAGGPIPRAKAARSLTHGGITTAQFLAIHVMGAGFPLVAGLVLYGWRALGSVIVVLGAAAAAIAAWRRIGRRGEQLNFSHGLYLALLLALSLPPHLLSDTMQVGNQIVLTWPLLPAAAIILVIATWALGGLGSSRIHPVVLAHLLIVALAGDLLIPHTTLQKSHAFFGDVLKAGDPSRLERVRGPWNSVKQIAGQDAVRSVPASQLLTTYTSGIERPEGSFLSLEALLRDHMPPLEDLIVGGAPGPIGTSSAIAIVIGGMFLMYRGVIDYRISLFMFVAALLALLVLPVPVVIRQTAREWHWMAMLHRDVSLPAALTFANYELMASPLTFVAFFLATEPGIRPIARRARTIYAILIGVVAAALQLYCSVRAGPYLAMLLVGLLAPIFDRWFVPRTLV
jgi:Na+-translocating ferredoxin:NAD+ oxidoreductase RnfD subunit